MSSTTLETRLAKLEAQVSRLQDELRELQARKDEDWRRAVAQYAGDEDLQSVLAEAMKLREADRKRACEGRRDSSGKQG